MELQVEKHLATEINRHLDDDTTDRAPDLMHAATTRYSDPGRTRDELALLFRRYPLALVHESALPAPGDFVVHDHAGLPLLIVRQPDGTVRVMLNACRHRGARLVHDESGNRRAALVCRFHAWSYALDGDLRAVPGSGFCSLDRAEHGLVRFPTEVRHGLVWAILTPGADIDVSAHLGPELDAELAGYRLDEHVAVRETTLHPRVDWKMVIDGFLENYHFKPLHSKSVGPYYKGDLGVCDELGPHIRHTAVRESFEEVRGRDVDEFELRHHVTIGYIIFPNTVLLSTADRRSRHMELWTSHPGPTPGQAAARVQLLVPAAAARDPRHESFWSRNWEVALAAVTGEDWPICETSQQTVETGLLDHFVFGANEKALQHFHREIDRALARGGAAGRAR